MEPLLFNSLTDFDQESCNDIEELKNYYMVLKRHFNFVTFQTKGCDQELYQIIFENVRRARATCILNLSSSEDFAFFDCPSQKEMIKCAFSEPFKIMKHFNPNASQSIMQLIQRIHQDHKSFSKNLVEYFSQDLSLHTLFGLSTFPAIYGFFSTQEYCKLGKDIILVFLSDESQKHLANAMLTSYFFCIFPFFQTMWTNLEYQITQTENYSFENILTCFVKSVESSVEILSIYHMQIINEYCRINFHECTDFFSKLFKSSFELYSTLIYIPFRAKVQIYHVIDMIKTDFSKPFMAILQNQKKRGCIIPEYPKNTEIHRFPMIMSDRDILVIMEILKNDQPLIFPLENLAKSRALFTNGYTPFTFDMYNAYPKELEPTSKAPEGMVKLYRELRSKFNEDEILDLIQLSPKFDNDWVKYAYRYEISALKCNAMKLKYLLDTKFRINTYQSWLDKIELTQMCELVSHCFRVPGIPTQIQIMEISKLPKILSNVFSNIYQDETLSFPILIATLSKFNINYIKANPIIYREAIACIKEYCGTRKLEDTRIPDFLKLIGSQIITACSLVNKTFSIGSIGEVLFLLFKLQKLSKSPEEFWTALLPNVRISVESRISCVVRAVFNYLAFRFSISQIDNPLEQALMMMPSMEKYIFHPFYKSAALIKMMVCEPFKA